MTVTLLIFNWLWELQACGPFFPNWLLVNTKDNITSHPLFDFDKELLSMRLVHPYFKAVNQKDNFDYPVDTLDAEIADLLKALEMEGLASDNRKLIADNHRIERKRISVFAGLPRDTEFILLPDAAEPPRISGAPPSITPGLPSEFADYFRGSIAWHSKDIKKAREIWTTLLERPENERHFKSTWAAFMLGRSWHKENPGKALVYYRKVRELAEKGFADSLGLAASSLGWEADILWDDNKYTESFDLYLQQAAGGDLIALISLRDICGASFGKGAGVLRLLANDEKARRTITAYVASYGNSLPTEDVDCIEKEIYLKAKQYAAAKYPAITPYCPGSHTYESRAKLWLKAVENSGVKDSECFDKLALAAYLDGEMDIAKRWIDRAPDSPLCKWLKAKLLLRDGKMEDAAKILAELVRLFPPLNNASAPPKTYPLKFKSFYKNTYVPSFDWGYGERLETINEINGEYAVLQLARRQYVEALDLLTRSGFQDDASYIAERVLEVEELKKYVDENWPTYLIRDGKQLGTGSMVAEDPDAEIKPAPINGDFLRYLLARRLARSGLYKDARSYYPDLQLFDEYCRNIEKAENSKLPREERGRAYFEAAKIARNKGMELFGTEVGPDWLCFEGSCYDKGPSLLNRTEGTFCTNASSDEIMRAEKHVPEPNTRFHYRYNAAELAWKAAEMMPDNSDETAKVLCVAGSWLKARDPMNADTFYKSLVRRCRNTKLGAEADRIRWFPPIDANGNLKIMKTPQDSP